MLQAPNYFKVVTRPMDLATMQSKLSQDKYSTWDDLQADFSLMFDNCMIYNQADTPAHKAVWLCRCRCIPEFSSPFLVHLVASSAPVLLMSGLLSLGRQLLAQLCWPAQSIMQEQAAQLQLPSGPSCFSLMLDHNPAAFAPFSFQPACV